MIPTNGGEIIEPPVKEMLETVLNGVAARTIGVTGIKSGDSLDGVVLPLSGPPDGSVEVGYKIHLGNQLTAEVMDIGTEEHDGHVFYQIKLYEE
ncbi:MAG: hypothetical protein IH934_07960 [Nanoarchaeota archaeon]|nr:hypothetical protein [Nanoarchaeota archaeon]